MSEQIEQLLDAAKAAKAATEAVQKSHEELDIKVSKIHEDLEKEGKENAISKMAFQDSVIRVEKAEEALDKVTLELNELSQKASNTLGQNTVKSIGELAAESDAAKNYKGGNATLAEFEGSLFTKANITSDAASAGVLTDPYHVPGIQTDPDAPLTVRDLFSTISISQNAIEWVKELLFTNNAAPQNGEGTVKAESALTFEKMTSSVETLAHWMPASRQILADAPQLRDFVNTKLRNGLKIKEDDALLFGDGTNGNLLGLVPQSTAYDATGIPVGATAIDAMRWAFLQVNKAQYPATFGVLSLDDWAKIQMQKTTDGAYIFGTPNNGAAPRLWGKRIVESHGMAAGDFLAGSGLAATIYDREQVTVRVAEQHDDFFVRNMVAILCEERLGFTVERPQAIVAGTLPV